MSVCAVHRLPHESKESSWCKEYFSFLNEKLDQIESEIGMDKLEDITNALFQNKSEILGQMALGLIEDRHGDLLEQEYCNCPNCGNQTKAWNKKVKRKIESLAGSFDLYRPYFYCKNCNTGFYPLDEALGLSESPKQYDIQALEAWLSSELPFETAAEAFSRCTGDTLSTDHVFQTANGIANHLDILNVCPTKEEMEEKISELSEGKFRRPVIMLAIDGATYAKSETGLQRVLNLYWVIHNFLRVQFTTKEVPAISLGVIESGLTAEKLFSTQLI